MPALLRARHSHRALQLDVVTAGLLLRDMRRIGARPTTTGESMTAPTCCNQNCRQGRDCPLRARQLHWDRQKEGIERLTSAVGDNDQVRSAGDQQDIGNAE